MEPIYNNWCFFLQLQTSAFFWLFWTDRMILYYKKRIQVITLKQVTGFPIEFLPTKKWHLVFGQLHNRAPLSVVICLKLRDLSKKVQKDMGRWEVFVHCPVGMVFNFISCWTCLEIPLDFPYRFLKLGFSLASKSWKFYTGANDEATAATNARQGTRGWAPCPGWYDFNMRDSFLTWNNGIYMTWMYPRHLG